MRFTIYIALLFYVFLVLGQEGQFSQYFAASSLMSPAYSGVIPNLSMNANYKTGGTKSSDSYVELMQATFTYPFKRVTSKDQQIGGAGITYFRESRGFQGVYSSQKIILSGSYRLKFSQLNNQYLIFGLQGGVVQNQLNGNNLQWGSQYNKYLSQLGGYDQDRVGENLANTSVFYPVFNFGVVYSTYDNEDFYVRDKSLLIGASVDNLNRPLVSNQDVGNSRKSMLFKGFASAKLGLAPRWFIHPSAFVLYSNGSQQINVGTYFTSLVSSVKSRTAWLIQMGSWYRVGDSIIFLAGFQVDNLRLGVSFDMNTQSVDIFETGNQLPTYEVSLTYNLNLAKPLRHIPSPIL